MGRMLLMSLISQPGVITIFIYLFFPLNCQNWQQAATFDNPSHFLVFYLVLML